MSPLLVGVIGMAIFLIVMFIGFNIPFAMLIGGAIGLILMRGMSTASTMIASEFINTFSSYTLTIGPMFGLMGYMASFSGIGEKLFTFLKTMIGHRKGGLSHAVQLACVAFGAICGSPVATNATFTTVAYPEMRKAGYSAELSATTIIGGGTLAVLIPPSTTLIIYGIATETSITHLFMAGILCGILMAIVNFFTIVYVVKRHPDWAVSGRRYSWRERWKACKNGGIIEIVVVFIIAMGGMFAGFFTPTEAGAVGAFGMTIVALISRQLTWKKFFNAIFQGIKLMAMIYLLFACANVLARMFTLSTIPIAVGNWVAAMEVPGVLAVIVILVIYFILGCFADMQSMMLVTLPIFFPIIVSYAGFSPVWFGIIMVILMSIGSMTPPVGTAVFFQKAFIQPYDPDVSVGRLFGSIWPWVINRAALTLILVAIPQAVTLLPHLVYDIPL